MRLYIAGPMTSIKDFNHPKFNEVARILRETGSDVVNPAELDGGNTSNTWEYYMRRDIASLLTCDGIVLLEGWEQSKGALFEYFVAKQLKLKVIYWSDAKKDVIGIPAQLYKPLLDNISNK